MVYDDPLIPVRTRLPGSGSCDKVRISLDLGLNMPPEQSLSIC